MYICPCMVCREMTPDGFYFLMGNLKDIISDSYTSWFPNKSYCELKFIYIYEPINAYYFAMNLA